MTVTVSTTHERTVDRTTTETDVRAYFPHLAPTSCVLTHSYHRATTVAGLSSDVTIDGWHQRREWSYMRACLAAGLAGSGGWPSLLHGGGPSLLEEGLS